jgi:hypothetical protein
MPVFKNADVYIKPGGGGGGWGGCLGVVLVLSAVLIGLMTLGILPDRIIEHNGDQFRSCTVRSIFFVIETKKGCGPWQRYR